MRLEFDSFSVAGFPSSRQKLAIGPRARTIDSVIVSVPAGNASLRCSNRNETVVAAQRCVRLVIRDGKAKGTSHDRRNDL